MTVEEMAGRFIPVYRNGYLGLNGQTYKLRNEALKANIEYLQAESESNK